MFSYLHGIRPNSRRSAIPPVTTPHDATSARSYHDAPLPQLQSSHLPAPQAILDANSPSPVSPVPPILPPIPRVASRSEHEKEEEPKLQMEEADSFQPGKSTENSMQRPRSASQTSELRGIRPPGLGLKDHRRRISKDRVADSPPEAPEWKPRPPQSNPVRLAGELYDPTRPSPASHPQDVPGPMHGPLMPPHFQQLAVPPPPPKSPPHRRPYANTSRSGKNKLNLLNPMSLLARRRSSQRVVEASEKYSKLNDAAIPALRLPDDYDPRIRGKGVHDFSVPRSAQSNQSPPKSSHGSRQGSDSAPVPYERSPSSTEKEHTPVFKENFDDDAEPWQDGREGSSKRQKSAFMYKVAVQEPYTEPDRSSLPAFARNLPADFPGDPEPIQRIASPPRAPLEVVAETATSGILPKDLSPVPSPPTSPPSKARSRASSDTDASFTPAGLPTHFKSNASRASRFSFDLAGVGSAAQEKLLEEKHRQKAKEKARTSTGSRKSFHRYESDDEQDPDLEDFDDDGLEERIPGVNADEVEDIPLSGPGMPAMEPPRFEPASKPIFASQMSPVSEGFSPISPQDVHNQPAKLAVPESSPNTAKDEDSPVSHEYSDEDHRSQRESGTTIDNDFEIPSNDQLPAKPLEGALTAHLRSDEYPEDDMYFDDGMIEDLDGTNEQIFDESVFDDETSRVYGLPIRDQPKSQLSDMNGETSALNPEGQRGLYPEVALTEDSDGVGDENIAAELRDSLPDLTQASRPVFSHTAGLTQDNLAAYHDALAIAANQAAMNGKFMRRASLQSDQSNDPLSPESKHLDPFPPVGESPSLEINGYPLPNVSGSDEYDFDDAASDDAIIAAANAEALENDDEDFYGQEFGFYARKTGGSDEYTNGGYFGPGVNRTHSGRNVEPALTPITERSEWSNRNSAISLAMHGYPTSALSQPSPGLAQLADMMTLEESNENDMSLSALMKLRRGAWGSSSTTSLHSSSGNSSGSPLTYTLPGMPANSATGAQIQPQQQQGQAYPMLNTNIGASTYSLNSSTTEDSPASDTSHTITLPTTVSLPPSNPAMNAPYLPPPSHSRSGSEGSPTQIRPRSSLFSNGKGKAIASKGGGGGQHSRNASKDGESVSYVHERDEEGDRWVLEKRKIGQGGVVEVLGREVVEGGRI
ncbi:MAG: hypothetical protein Q9191_001777 [Dirinaria sp. TL-2023a]